jgi:hypothetical protein
MERAINNIEKLEVDLWSAADNLRANSKLTSSDYFMPETVVCKSFFVLSFWLPHAVRVPLKSF